MPLQVTNFAPITGLDESNFALPNNSPFLVKNDTATEIYENVLEGVDVTLEVIPAASETNEWVPVIFRYDWNPMLVRAVKATATECTLIWGQ
jgi:hypothetical protein